MRVVTARCDADYTQLLTVVPLAAHGFSGVESL